MARAASALSPAMRTIRPQRVLREAPTHSATRERDADEEQRVDLQRRAHLRDVAPAAERDRRRAAAPAAGCSGLPRKNARPVPNSISAMPMAMSLTRGSVQMQPCSSAEQRAGDGPRPARRARASRSGTATRVGGHRAEHQRAFEAEVDAARLLGQALAEAHEQERRARRGSRRRAWRAARPMSRCRVSPSGAVLRRSSGCEALEAAVEASRWPGCTTKIMPCSTSTVASGRPEAPLQQAAGWRRCRRAGSRPG